MGIFRLHTKEEIRKAIFDHFSFTNIWIQPDSRFRRYKPAEHKNETTKPAWMIINDEFLAEYGTTVKQMKRRYATIWTKIGIACLVIGLPLGIGIAMFGEAMGLSDMTPAQVGRRSDGRRLPAWQTMPLKPA